MVDKNKTKTQLSELNWKIYILILNFLFLPLDF